MPESWYLERQAIEENGITGIFTPMEGWQAESGELGQVLSFVSDAVVAIDIGHRITYFNQAAERLYNVKAVDAYARPLNEVYQYRWREDADEQAAYDALAKTGFWQGQVIHIKNNGEEIYVECSAIVVKDRSDNVIGLLAFCRDITERKQIEDRLRNSEEKFRTCVENMLDGLAIYSAIRDRSGDIIDLMVDYVNKAATQSNAMMGQLEVGKRLKELQSAHQTSGLFEEYCGVVETGEPLIKESFIYEGERQKRFFDIRVTKLDDGCVVTWRDVTARKIAEEQQRKSEERLRSYFTLPLVGIAVTSPEKGWLEVNDKLCEIFGYPRDELMQMTWTELTYPEDLAADLEQFNRVLAGKSEGYSMEKRFIRKDLEVIYASISARCVRRADRSIDYFVALVDDITARKRAEEERDRFFSLSLDLLCIAGLDGYFKRLNPVFEKTLGYSLEELQGQPFLDFIHPEDREATIAEIEKLSAGTPTLMFENRYRCKNGKYLWLAWTSFPIVEEGIIYAIARDVSDRKQTEETLQRREQELKTLVENTPDVIIRIDRNLRYLYVNPEVERATGMPAAELIGKTSQELGIAPELCQLWDQTLQKVFATNTQQVIEYQAPSVNGLRTYQSRIVPELDENGIAKYALVVARDISELKLAETERIQLVYEQAARAEAESGRLRLDFLCQASGILTSSLDYEKTLKSVADLSVPYVADWCCIDLLEEGGNIRRLAIAHLDRAKEKLGWELTQRYPPHLNDPVGTSKVLRRGISQIANDLPDAAIVAVARDLEHLRIMRELGLKSCMIVPLAANGKTLGAISFIFAESSRRYNQEDLVLAEELARRAALAVENARLYRKSQEANRMKDGFLAIVSHELRTPLQSVLGWTQLLRTRKFDETAKVEALEKIERNAKSQKKLIDEILDFSKMIAGELPLNFRACKLAVVIYGALDLVRPEAKVKNIDLVSSLESMKIAVKGDRDRLQQVVFHLLSNAVKFTPNGGRVEIKLSTVTGNEDRPSPITNYPLPITNYAEITVTDTGIGISPEFLPYVFDRFHQAENVKTRSQGGLGLGLATVRQLVELHGGMVFASSRGEGLGATFSVFVPLLSE